jgi:phosphate transport system protein
MTTVPEHGGGDSHHGITESKVLDLRRRFLREAAFAVSMLEAAVGALWALDVAAARAVRRSDDQVDAEEVAIEQAVHEVMALRAPVAREFRTAHFILRANATVERVGDHATSIAKVVVRIADHAAGRTPDWPTALVELGQRVPAICHQTLGAVQDEDPVAARRIIAGDPTIDQLERRLFDETIDLMSSGLLGPGSMPIGLLVYRAGRELERVGDLMASLAEDLVYLCTGEIVRHEKRRLRAKGAEDKPS